MDRGAKNISPKALTMRRRELNYESAYNLTVDRGRPDKFNFNQCRDPMCRYCGYTDYDYVARLRSVDKHGEDTWEREEIVLDTLAAHFWGSETVEWKEKAEQRKRIKSFVYSPPLMGAFAVFSGCLEKNDRGMKFDTESIAESLTEHRKGFIDDLEALRNGTIRDTYGDKHSKLFSHGHYFSFYPFSWDMKDFMLQFILASESWRLFSVEKQGAKMWDFPGADDAGKVVDFLSAVLLNFVYMRNNRAAGFYRLVPAKHNKDWEVWDDRYQVFSQKLEEIADKIERGMTKTRLVKEAAEEGKTMGKEEVDAMVEAKVGLKDGEVKDGEVVFEGYGKGADREAWMTKRMKVSVGLGVPGYKP